MAKAELGIQYSDSDGLIYSFPWKLYGKQWKPASTITVARKLNKEDRSDI